jgi:hypothetical protein
MGLKDAETFAWKPFPCTPFLPWPPHRLDFTESFHLFSRALTLETIGECDDDFFGADRRVAKSGEEGSEERWSGTRLWLALVAMALSLAMAFLAATTVSAVSFFI